MGYYDFFYWNNDAKDWWRVNSEHSFFFTQGRAENRAREYVENLKVSILMQRESDGWSKIIAAP